MNDFEKGIKDANLARFNNVNQIKIDGIENKVIENFEKGLLTELEFGAAFEEIDILKGGKRAVIGEQRMFAGRLHVKTQDGWKFVGKGKGAKAQAHVGTKEKTIGKTSTGKPIYGDLKAYDEKYKDFTDEDHHEAAKAHQAKYDELWEKKDSVEEGMNNAQTQHHFKAVNEHYHLSKRTERAQKEEKANQKAAEILKEASRGINFDHIVSKFKIGDPEQFKKDSASYLKDYTENGYNSAKRSVRWEYNGVQDMPNQVRERKAHLEVLKQYDEFKTK